MTRPHPDPHRRALLASLAALPAAGALGSAAEAQAQAAAVGLISASVCLVQPETTQGPYYLDKDLVRADIREDCAGVPMTMQMQVVSAECMPIAGARVDLWHCDAQGNYSGYATQGSDGTLDTTARSFLRGTQFTGADGTVAFDTIYPGWYRGRTTHLHYKVFLDERTVLTSQIFLPDALSEYIYANAAAYGGRTQARDTFNRNDWIATEAGDGAYASVREQADRYVAALVVGVNPMTTSTEAPPPFGGPPGGPPGNAPPPDAASSPSPAEIIPGG